jgi:hypothetical protein
MKNHWLKLHNDKKKRFWTIEFSSSGYTILNSRTVSITDMSHNFIPGGGVSGLLAAVFKDGMITGDYEFNNFITEAGKSMWGWKSTVRNYRSIFDEIENFQLENLSCKNIMMASNPDDLKFVFEYSSLKYTYLG